MVSKSESENENSNKIKDLAIEQINYIIKKKYPELSLVLRGKNNISYNNKTRTIEIGDKREVRTYRNLPQ